MWGNHKSTCMTRGARAAHGTDSDKECLRYVREAKAGSSDLRFQVCCPNRSVNLLRTRTAQPSGLSFPRLELHIDDGDSLLQARLRRDCDAKDNVLPERLVSDGNGGMRGMLLEVGPCPCPCRTRSSLWSVSTGNLCGTLACLMASQSHRLTA